MISNLNDIETMSKSLSKIKKSLMIINVNLLISLIDKTNQAK